MSTQPIVLLVGGTGRTGGRVLRQLLDRGVHVRAIVRSREKLPPDVASDPNVTVIEASLLSLADEELRRYVAGCEAIVSCLGHVISLGGIFGPPRDLVTQATTRLCRAVQAQRPDTPVKFVLMSSVSVQRPENVDALRGNFDKAVLSVFRGVIPPTKDNQQAADFLRETIGPKDPFVEWVAVRPDTLLEGEVTPYTLHEGLVSSLLAPDHTNMANVAHFMCELVTNPKTWAQWRWKMPVIVNDADAREYDPIPVGARVRGAQPN